MPDHIRISRFLSLILRHQPGQIGLSLDSQGWAVITELLRLANNAGVTLNRETLQHVVEVNDKQRFAISLDGLRIRANQGHSISVDLNLAPLPPPEVLFHGTATCFLKSISEQGLIPGNRQHVHLSTSEKTALNVGARHGKPLVLTVNSQAMFVAGYNFYRAENGVWLTSHVPVEYLTE